MAGEPVTGTVNSGVTTTSQAPVLIGGIDAGGVARTLLVNSNGSLVVPTRGDLLLAGLGIIAESFRLNAAPNNVAALGATGVSSVAVFAPVGLRAGDVVAGGCCFQAGAATSPTLAKMGLYDSAGNFLKATADFSGSLATNSFLNNAWSGGSYTVPSDGLYYLALLTLASSAQPTFAASATVTGRGAAIGAHSLPAGQVTSQSNLSGNVTIAGATTLWWLAATS